MAPTYEPNRSGMREYLRSPALYPALEAQARLVEQRAKNSAHVETAASALRRDRVPGRFRDSIHTERHKSPDRIAVRVVADCDGAAVIEARDRTLGRAAG